MTSMQKVSAILKISKAADTLQNYTAPTGDNAIDPFRERNLIYGYNGAGKTTISRIFEYIGTGKCPAGIDPDFDFEFKIDGKKALTRKSDLSSFRDRVAVYNEDYIQRNFAWADTSATAQPIFGLGEQNIADVEALNAARQKLPELSAQLEKAQREAKKVGNTFDVFCTETARNIERQAHDTRRFTAATLKKKIAHSSFDPTFKLTDAEFKQGIETLKQPAPDPHDVQENPIDGIQGEFSAFLELLASNARQIKLAELVDHPQMNDWVDAGRTYHTEQGIDHCLFCGSELTDDRLQQLADHFSDEVNSISRQVTETKRRYESARATLLTFLQASPTLSKLRGQQNQDAAEKLELDRQKIIEKLCSLLERFEELLAEKLREPANPLQIEGEITLRDTFQKTYDQFAGVVQQQTEYIRRHNLFIEEFDSERKSARTRITDHLTAEATSRFNECQTAVTDAEAEVGRLAQQFQAAQATIAEKEAALREHAQAAGELNREIASFLRHRRIKLIAVDEGYQLQRVDGTPVTKLSEGEKTAITFCHFITSLEANNRKLRDMIVVVDDPISSLDTRAMTYMASLIRYRLDKAGQLFVMTHNLPFMSEARKWIYSRKKMEDERKQAKENKQPNPPVPLYILNLHSDEETNARWSVLSNMGSLLRDYEGEYHYLYSLVHHYAKQSDPTSEYYLLIPNAIRKVMETYLLFKLPNNQNFGSAIMQMAGDLKNPPTLHALRKFAELEGHGEDLSAITTPAILTTEEAHPAAQELMALIKETDPMHAKQMERLCKKSAW